MIPVTVTYDTKYNTWNIVACGSNEYIHDCHPDDIDGWLEANKDKYKEVRNELI